MKRILILILSLCVFACKEKEEKQLSAQEIVDKSIAISGGQLYLNHDTSFKFRNSVYVSQNNDGKKTLKRISKLDSLTITDIRTRTSLRRFMNDSLMALPDSVANRYANSVNSVHYFARLPFGLNDGAVNKKLLGEETIKGKEYYKLKVTFDQDNGGKDFEDTYVYWFDKQSFKPDYLAYEFHTDGGGQRFREAYNERYVNGIRFVDYNNFKPKTKGTSIFDIGKLFEKEELDLLSKIALDSINVDKS